MATFFLDYEGGSDAADGTTFANRWKTITAGATAARIAPGDVIRVMKSPDPTSLGINATWTNKSATITLASALNALITDCESAWTGSANVTATLNTTTFIQPSPRSGSGCARFAIAGAFTTGKAAYFDLGSNQDYSGYQGITFWIYQEVLTLPASTLSIRLCSDATGDVTVDTLAIPAISQTGQWVPVHINKGSALGNSIRSIALYADADPGAMTLQMDNISTTKAAGNDCLTLLTLLGKNTAGETWFAPRSINGTTVLIDTNPQMVQSGVSRGYYGTTESVATYIRKTIVTDLVATSTTNVHAIQDSGTAGSFITFIGGWNTTDMSTQDGETWFDGRTGFGNGIAFNAKSYVKIDQLHMTRYNRGVFHDGTYGDLGTCSMNNSVNGLVTNSLPVSGDTTTPGLQATSVMCACNGGNGWSTSNLTRARITTLKLLSNGFSGVTSGWGINGDDLEITTLVASNNFFHGLIMSGVDDVHWRLGSVTCNDNGQTGLIGSTGTFSKNVRIDSLTCSNNGNHGATLSVGILSDWFIKAITLASNSAAGINLSHGIGSRVVIGSLTTSGHGASAAVTFATGGGEVAVLASSFGEAVPLGLSSSAYAGGRVSFQNFDGVAGDHRIYYNAGTGGGTIVSETGGDRHTPSGLAWEFAPLTETYIQAEFPMRLPLMRLAVKANLLVTFRAWIKRDNTGITAKIVCRGGQIGGVANDVVATASGAAGSYQEETITFTPNEDGVVEIEAQVYGGTTFKAWYDDLTYSQA